MPEGQTRKEIEGEGVKDLNLISANFVYVRFI
jgi:hypothetical protein